MPLTMCEANEVKDHPADQQWHEDWSGCGEDADEEQTGPPADRPEQFHASILLRTDTASTRPLAR